MKYIVDIDGTICEEFGPVESRIPFKDRIERINALYDTGHEIVYMTARGMASGRGEEQYRLLTEQQLQNWGCKYHKLLFGKPNADYYIDDKGINDLDFFKNPPYVDAELTVIIPMAGNGSRFAEIGVDVPKPLITVNGKPMINLVVEKMNIDANYLFIVRKEHCDKFGIDDHLRELVPNCTIVYVDEVTEGAACTVLLAKEYINNDKPILIVNSDQYINWKPVEYLEHFKDFDGGMVTFIDSNPAWSYAKVNDRGFITEVAEKKVISRYATAGYYYWSRGSDFVESAEELIRRDLRTNNEFYVAPVYNMGIENGKRYVSRVIDRVEELGTPDMLSMYLKEYYGI